MNADWRNGSYTMPPADDPTSVPYGTGKIFNLDGSAYISGHSDIAVPAVAHAFWQAILAATK